MVGYCGRENNTSTVHIDEGTTATSCIEYYEYSIVVAWSGEHKRTIRRSIRSAEEWIAFQKTMPEQIGFDKPVMAMKPPVFVKPYEKQRRILAKIGRGT